jgi:hypothetical protein
LVVHFISPPTVRSGRAEESPADPSLADDVAAPAEWLQAAGNIVQHENVLVVPGSTAFTQTVATQLPPGGRPKLPGDALRAEIDPSVAELMALRGKEIDPGEPVERNSKKQFRVASANQMASMLAECDIQAALPVLKARVERCARVVQAGQKAGARVFGLEIAIANMTDLRARASDPEALGDYATWVRTLTPDHLTFSQVLCSGPAEATPTIPRSPPRPPSCSKIRHRPGILSPRATTPRPRKDPGGNCSPHPCSA